MTSDMINAVKKTAEENGCPFYENEPLSEHTTFGIGGRCPIMADVVSERAAVMLLRLFDAENIPFYIIGRGSNLLVDDRGADMVFLRIGSRFSEIKVKKDIMTCQAGAALSAASAAARDRELTGLEFAYGIPGSAGGAVYMNAGAYGGEMKDIVTEVRAADREGNIRTFAAEELDFGYRHSVFTGGGYVILSVSMRLRKGSREEISAKMDELTEKRKSKQPLEYRSAGSTFKRPKNDFAARLIEECGLKGCSCGEAQVSEKHSGFVINKGGASFEDVMHLIDHVKKTVYEKTGVLLECEPEIITDRQI